MIAPVKDVPIGTDKSGEATALAELRESVNEIAGELSKVAERRTRAARETAEAGADALRGTIRRQPTISVAVAALAGAVLAVAVVPRWSTRSARDAGWRAWAPSVPVTRSELHDVAEGIQRSLARATNAMPLTSSFERLLEAVTKIEPSASFNSTLEKAASWFQRMQSRAAQAQKSD